jgi:Flp pilus assembly secretin CpaC
MTPERRRSNWLPLILQTVVIIGGAFGAVVAYTRTDEHRITVLEVENREAKKTVVEMKVTMLEIQKTLTAQLAVQVKTVVLLEAVESRHRAEDSRNR